MRLLTDPNLYFKWFKALSIAEVMKCKMIGNTIQEKNFKDKSYDLLRVLYCHLAE
jgi:hypothetical protein